MPLYITFCGHREVFDEKLVYSKLLSLLDDFYEAKHFTSQDPDDKVIVYYCGGYGQFDGLVSRAIDEMKKRHPEIKSKKIFVTPYITESAQEKIKYIITMKFFIPRLKTCPRNMQSQKGTNG